MRAWDPKDGKRKERETWNACERVGERASRRE